MLPSLIYKKRGNQDIDVLMDRSAMYDALARYWEQLGYIKNFSKEMVRITSRGIQYVEGDLVQQAASRVTFNVRNAYGSIFGTQQHAEMSVSFATSAR
jgi:hypothetical protein